MIPNFYIIEDGHEQTVGFDIDSVFDVESTKDYISTVISNIEFINGRVLNDHTTYAKVTIKLYDAEWLKENGCLARSARFFNKNIKDPKNLVNMINSVYLDIKDTSLFKKYLRPYCRKILSAELIKKSCVHNKSGYYHLYIAYQ